MSAGSPDRDARGSGGMPGCVAVRAAAWEAMLAHAREAAPDECCGLLVGAVGSVTDAVPVPNLDPRDHIALNRRLRGTGRGVVGCYHSHPDSPPVPSPSDIAEAAYPEFLWVIVSLQPPAPALAGYRLAPDTAPCPVVLIRELPPMLTEAIRTEFLRYKALAERALEQVADADLTAPGPGQGSSIAVICRHVSGNLRSRFTDFLTTDGEKPWRNREEEFSGRETTREEVLAAWNAGWTTLLDTLASLEDDDLARSVLLRGESLPARDALLRALAHISYHVGQVVYLAKGFRGADWHYLSIPPGGK